MAIRKTALVIIGGEDLPAGPEDGLFAVTGPGLGAEGRLLVVRRERGPILKFLTCLEERNVWDVELEFRS